MPRVALVVACLALALPARGHGPHRDDGSTTVVALPGVRQLRYEPPPPGSYELPPIQQLERHELLDPSGATALLPDVAPDGVALVSFVYLTCPAACPLTHAILQRVDRQAAEDEGLRRRLRLVTVSFDPSRDTPERMGRLREQLAPRLDWRFLTAADAAGIEPVLADFGQDASAARDDAGDGRIEHVLKVFLVDSDLRVRNVYSTEYLDPAILLNDVRTLLAEEPG